MKRIIFILLLLTTYACSQFQPDTMNIAISIPAPQEVQDSVRTLRCYIEKVPVGQQLALYNGIPLASARALGGVLTSTYQSNQLSFGLEVEANGEQYAVGVFGLDASGAEVIKLIGNDRYLLRCSVASGLLPLIQTVNDHIIYLNVTVNFQ